MGKDTDPCIRETLSDVRRSPGVPFRSQIVSGFLRRNYADGAVFVLGTRFEGMPNVLDEAPACGMRRVPGA